MTIEIGVVQEGGSTERNTFLCVNLIDRQRQTLVHFFCFFCYSSFVFFKSCCQLVFCFCFSLSLTVTKFMHYFNKGCFRGTLIQWWKCFLNFFSYSILLLSICLFSLSPRRRHIVSRANWCMAPNTQSSKIQFSHYNSKLYITWLWIVQWNRNSLQLRLRLARPMGLPGAGQRRGWPWAWPDPDL